ncbi:MAG: extensin family protein [Sphingopyxis sp.]
MVNQRFTHTDYDGSMDHRLARLAPLAALALLSGCIGAPDHRRDAPSASSRPSAARTPQAAPSEATRTCFADLGQAGVRFTPLPDQQQGGGCITRGTLHLNDIGTPITNMTAITCPLARNFAAWIRHAVKPAARQVFGQDIARVETFGTYSCRNVYGQRSGRLSQHAFANAVDVSAFVLADGRRITVLGGWNGDDRDQRFLRLIHASACRRFGTVLSPDYNAAHANHFHLDMAAQSFCR